MICCLCCLEVFLLMSSSHSSRKVRTFFAAALLACATASAATVSASPAVKPATVATHASAHAATPVAYEAKSASLSGVSGMTKHEAAVTAPSVLRRHLPAAAESGYGTNARTENKISPLSPVTPTSPITPAIDLPPSSRLSLRRVPDRRPTPTPSARISARATCVSGAASTAWTLRGIRTT